MTGKTDAKRQLLAGNNGQPHGAALPKRMLMVLFAAFGGALALKAWEERRTADDALEAQQLREAMAVASYARSELVRAHAAFETALKAELSPREAAELARLTDPERSTPVKPVIAELDEANIARIFARDATGDWWSAAMPLNRITPPAQDDRDFKLFDEGVRAPGAGMDYQGLTSRSVAACAPVQGAAVTACVDREVPVLAFEDYNRLLIYALLIAAPALAVIGLLGTHVSNGRKLETETVVRKELEVRWREMEIGGHSSFWAWDEKTGLVDLSGQAGEMLGVPNSGNATMDQFLDLVSDKHREKVETTLRKATQNGDFVVNFQGSGAFEARFFELRGGPMSTGLSGILSDVSERVRAESRSRRAEQLARVAVEAYPGPFAAWDNRRRLLLWNASFVRTFALPVELVRQGASHDAVMAEAQKHIRAERSDPNAESVREMLLTSDTWIHYQERPLPNGGFISVGLDVSKMKEKEQHLAANERKLMRTVGDLERTQGQAETLAMRLAEQKSKAERASRSKSVFLANMSHELRTPLNAINGFSEMMLKEIYGPLGDARYKGYAQDILSSGQHLLDMINDILDMAKIEAGKMSLSTRMIDPVDAVDAAVRMIRRRASDKDIEIDLEFASDVPEIEGDHRAIKQMVLNLVSNSIKFTDQGGRIIVRIYQDGEYVAVSVNDNGIGIPKADLPRLAQPFEQSTADESRNSQGSGLGLALTKSFAEMHGGHLVIESEVNMGTTVTFYLPILGPQKPSPRKHAAIEA